MEYSKIKEVLLQEDYKFKGNKLYRLVWDDWVEQKPDSRGMVQLRPTGKKPETINWSEIQNIISGKEVPPLIEQVKQIQEAIKEPLPVEVIKARRSGLKPPPPLAEFIKAPTKNNTIRGEEIKLIREMLSQIPPPSINKIAKTINRKRLAVRYVIQQIKQGKKLKYEK
jgi:hypothetical protein